MHAPSHASLAELDDDAVSLAPSIATTSAADVPPRFDKADLKRLRTKLQPSGVSRWCREFKETLQDYSPRAVHLLSLPHEAALASVRADTNLAALDRWAARQALNCFDRDAPDVKLLMDTDDACVTAARTSVINLLPLLCSRSRAVNGEEARLRAAQFDARIYFVDGADESATQLKASQLRDDFQALPAERTAPLHALERALLSKLPASVSTQRQALEDKLIEAEAVSAHLPWTFDQLAKIAAQHIIAAARRSNATTPGKEINAGEAKQTRPRNSKCPCCGQAGHDARNCKSKCKTCNEKSCPGT